MRPAGGSDVADCTVFEDFEISAIFPRAMRVSRFTEEGIAVG